MNHTITQFEDPKINIRLILAGLWISTMLCYIYGDIIHLFKPGALEDMIAGNMGPLRSDLHIGDDRLHARLLEFLPHAGRH